MMLRCLSAYVLSERVTFDRSGTYLPKGAVVGYKDTLFAKGFCPWSHTTGSTL